jgi:glycosyltransferase involved in cell wall biosynthesis
MIVKDEEKFLARCLDSVKAVAAEIAIYDTGSTDRTMEIAREYTDKVYQIEVEMIEVDGVSWIADFSGARNISLQDKGDCDWILWIDADEEFEQADIPMLRSLMANDNIDAIMAWMLSPNGPEGIAAHPLPKFFRNGKGHFEGIVHNECVVDGSCSPALVRIHHYGYNLSSEQMMKKWERSKELLWRQINEDRSNTYAWRNLVRNYRAQRDYPNAINAARDVLEMVENGEAEISHISLQMVLTDLAAAYHGMELYDDAERTFLRLLEGYPNNIDGSFMMGELYRDLKRYGEAVPYYEQYIKALKDAKYGLTFDPIIVDTWGAAPKSYYALTECYKHDGQIDKSWMAFRTLMMQRYENHIDECFKFIRELDMIGGGTARDLAMAREMIEC